MAQAPRGAAWGAEDAGGTAMAVAFFGAGDGRQLSPYFRDLSYRGVSSATVGLADGAKEVVRVTYDPSRTSFADLLRVYFRRVDAADGEGQFKERGERYAPCIYAPDKAAYNEARAVLQVGGKHNATKLPSLL